MTVPFYERQWLNVELAPLSEHSQEVAGPGLFRRFYSELQQRSQPIDPHWAARKRSLGERIAREILDPWRRAHGRSPRVLALAVGTCIVEGVWIEQGYDVVLHECQEVSLAPVCDRFPGVQFILGDLRTLDVPAGFDIIAMLGAETTLADGEVIRLFRQCRAGMGPAGILIFQSSAVLSAQRSAKEAVKWMLRRRAPSTHVLWGWFRTPGEFAGYAHRAGLSVRDAWTLTQTSDDEAVLTARPSWARTIPPLRCQQMMLVLQPARGAEPR